MQFILQYLYYPLEELLYIIIALVIALTVHEYSHALMAHKFGDSTAKRQGRLTLNPLAHLDFFGTLMIFIAGFGWAKPVPVNYFNIRDKKYAGVIISIAGPISNLIIAIIAMGIWNGLLKLNIIQNLNNTTYYAVYRTFDILVYFNLVLFIFNLLPIPPLDGYRVIEDLAPKELRPRLIQLEQYGVFIFLILFITPIGNYFFSYIFNIIQPLVNGINDMYIFLFNL